MRDLQNEARQLSQQRRREAEKQKNMFRQIKSSAHASRHDASRSMGQF
jgi:hypothetical protein